MWKNPRLTSLADCLFRAYPAQIRRLWVVRNRLPHYLPSALIICLYRGRASELAICLRKLCKTCGWGSPDRLPRGPRKFVRNMRRGCAKFEGVLLHSSRRIFGGGGLLRMCLHKSCLFSDTTWTFIRQSCTGKWSGMRGPPQFWKKMLREFGLNFWPPTNSGSRSENCSEWGFRMNYHWEL